MRSNPKKIEPLTSLTNEAIEQESDPVLLRKHLRQLLGIIATAQEQYEQDHNENQALRNEINRLKGKQGKTEI